VLAVQGPLYNQTEGFFKDDNNTPTNQQTKQDLDQTRNIFVVTFVALAVWPVRN
jgi:hypothetical protein